MSIIRRSWVRDAPPHGRPDDPAANLVLPGRAHNAIRCTLSGRYPPQSPDLERYRRDSGPIITVADVDRMGDATLMRMPNFGRKTLGEMRCEIDRYQIGRAHV